MLMTIMTISASSSQSVADERCGKERQKIHSQKMRLILRLADLFPICWGLDWKVGPANLSQVSEVVTERMDRLGQ